ncbi:KEOPS complex subunit Pcc1 [Halobium salinum]|uniref:KEOPS complex subunit Pcc1 n=1 Tax=Halobium salinum TaxID=1364940 RepID=A0ABD5PCQ7_9EURY|nr:KEOPS complex subunit Pcc1 [Halobium salinum]
MDAGTDPDRADDAGGPVGRDAPAHDDLVHDAVLRFRYPDERHARLVAGAVGVEVGEIDDDRSAATVDRAGDEVVVRVRAADLVALRAGLNSWRRLVGVAEDVVGRAGGDPGRVR